MTCDSKKAADNMRKGEVGAMIGVNGKLISYNWLVGGDVYGYDKEVVYKCVLTIDEFAEYWKSNIFDIVSPWDLKDAPSEILKDVSVDKRVLFSNGEVCKVVSVVDGVFIVSPPVEGKYTAFNVVEGRHTLGGTHIHAIRIANLMDERLYGNDIKPKTEEDV